MVKIRALGSEGLAVSAMGLGCMGMSDFYPGGTEEEALATIYKAFDLGVTLFDTADMYGMGQNEMLLGKAIRTLAGPVVLATKFGIMRDPDGRFIGVNGRPDYVRRACEQSLRRLGVDQIDLYYQHRVDPETPIEDTVGALADLIREGKVRHIGLSEASVAQIRAAHAVHPIAAVQSEYSLVKRDAEREVLPTTRELGIGFVAYSPLGRGFLTALVSRADDFAEGDHRRASPLLSGPRAQDVRHLVAGLRTIAQDRRCTPSQVALAWALRQGEDIVPIPGTKRQKYLAQNVDAAAIAFAPEQLSSIEELSRPFLWDDQMSS